MFETPTLASARREIFHHDRNAPVDSLDFELKSMYDHHNELMKEPKEILQQVFTFDLKNWKLTGKLDIILFRVKQTEIREEEF